MKIAGFALAAVIAGGTLGAALFATDVDARARDVQIKSATKYYSISGRSPVEFATSMSQRGPFSGQHRRRVWATAARTMRYQIERQRRGGRCHVTRARIWMRIDYTMPKLRKGGVGATARKRWTQMYRILNTHERTHGRYYSQLAQQTHAALLKMRPSRSCRSLDVTASRLVERLSKRNQAINDRFDRTDRRNYRKMERIYSLR